MVQARDSGATARVQIGSEESAIQPTQVPCITQDEGHQTENRSDGGPGLQGKPEPLDRRVDDEQLRCRAEGPACLPGHHREEGRAPGHRPPMPRQRGDRGRDSRGDQERHRLRIILSRDTREAHGVSIDGGATMLTLKISPSAYRTLLTLSIGTRAIIDGGMSLRTPRRSA